MESMFSLAGKLAMVTGASRGLGLEIAKGLAGAGAHVMLTGRDRDTLEPAVTEIGASGGSAYWASFDIADETTVAQTFADLEDAHGGLDILVNNVGLRDRRDLFEFALDDVRGMLAVNLVAPFDLARRAAAQMKRRGGGRIINMTSIAGPIANSGDTAYTAAKGGLEAMTRALAAELGPSAITVNAVAPGFFATEANADKLADPSITEWLARKTSLGRWARPEEIAGAVVFLASPAASYVTGHTLVVDGGYITHF